MRTHIDRFRKEFLDLAGFAESTFVLLFWLVLVVLGSDQAILLISNH